ncbi:MAG: Na+/H+ antiporter subunit E [Candidatus Altiarchaeota archaeon]
MIVKRLYYAVLYVLNLGYNILKSAFNVSYLVLKGDVEPEVMEVKTVLEKPISHFFLANSITLTPGTLTVEVDSSRRVLKVAVIKPKEQVEVIPFERFIGGVFE